MGKLANKSVAEVLCLYECLLARTVAATLLVCSYATPAAAAVLFCSDAAPAAAAVFRCSYAAPAAAAVLFCSDATPAAAAVLKKGGVSRESSDLEKGEGDEFQHDSRVCVVQVID